MSPSFNVYHNAGMRKPAMMYRTANKYQKVRHFPEGHQICRKAHLWLNIARLMAKFPEDYAIAPTTYVLSLPGDYAAFQAARESDPSKLWICKPIE